MKNPLPFIQKFVQKYFMLILLTIFVIVVVLVLFNKPKPPPQASQGSPASQGSQGSQGSPASQGSQGSPASPVKPQKKSWPGPWPAPSDSDSYLHFKFINKIQNVEGQKQDPQRPVLFFVYDGLRETAFSFALLSPDEKEYELYLPNEAYAFYISRINSSGGYDDDKYSYSTMFNIIKNSSDAVLTITEDTNNNINFNGIKA